MTGGAGLGGEAETGFGGELGVDTGAVDIAGVETQGLRDFVETPFAEFGEEAGGETHDVDGRVDEVGAAEAGPVLKRYLGVATATRPYFKATKDSPVSEFVAEAGEHPVFEVIR